MKLAVDACAMAWHKGVINEGEMKMFKTTAHYKSRKIVETFATWQEARDRANWHWSKGADVAEWGQ